MFRHLNTRFIANVCLRRTANKWIDVNLKQSNIPKFLNSSELLLVRNKYITSGVQGRRNSKTPPKKIDEDADEIIELDETDDDISEMLKDSAYDALANAALGLKSIRSEENILIIQPYIKWGPQKSNISPDIKLQEAEDLIQSLDTWSISDSIKVPLTGFGKRTFFGRGKIDELKKMVKRYNGDINQKVRFNASPIFSYTFPNQMKRNVFWYNFQTISIDYGSLYQCE